MLYIATGHGVKVISDVTDDLPGTCDRLENFFFSLDRESSLGRKMARMSICGKNPNYVYLWKIFKVSIYGYFYVLC